MARILPSQVVSYIDSAFLFASSQQARQEIGLDAGSANQVAALLELLDKIPGELVSLDEQPSVEFFASKAALHEASELAQAGKSGRTDREGGRTTPAKSHHDDPGGPVSVS
jgi:hypothetical protein